MNRNTMRGALALVATLIPSMAFAHSGHDDTVGFISGALHPLGGHDHMLAMIVVGLIAFQLGGRALWAVPATFIAFMAIGGGLGMAGVEVPFLEIGIMLSLVVLGLLAAFPVKNYTAITAVLVAGFAAFHGFAHGAEMPSSSSALAYAGGFIASTALLHAAGIATGYLLSVVPNSGGDWIARSSGGAAAAVGVMMLSGVI